MTVYKTYNTYTGEISVDGTYYSYWKLYKVRTYIKEVSQHTNVTVHELGHALGWMGHSTSSSDLMYTYANGLTTPQSRDISHLKQFYDLFY